MHGDRDVVTRRASLDRADEYAGSCLLSRREALMQFAAAGIALVAARPGGAAEVAPGVVCVARPEQTDGPFFVEEALDRVDIRSDPTTGRRAEGLPLRLEFFVGVLADTRCTPLRGAKIDLWHCDASGRYSDVDNFGVSTLGQKFLRGYQLTDSEGRAAFATIYPGAYAGRAVHVHFKIRTASASGRAHEFTSQLYFDDAFSDQVYAQAPYPARQRRLRNADDYLYRSGGRALTLAPQPSSDGLFAHFSVGLAIA